MEFTGERFIPGIGLGSDITVEHYQRYYAVLDLVKDKVVLDAASGEGYGSELMSQHASQVYGLDNDIQTLTQAREKYTSPNLSFTRGTIAKLPFQSDFFDVAVSFETIEHIPADLHDLFAAEVKRTLKPEGLFVISTPDKLLYSDIPHYKNEFHVREYYREEFQEFLARHFKNVVFWEQTSVLAYVLSNGRDKYLRNVVNPDSSLKGKYIVAICSNSQIKETELGAIQIDHDDLYNKKVARVLELQDEINEKNRYLAINEDEIKKKAAHINYLEKKIQQLVSDNELCTGELGTCHQTIDKLHADLERSNTKLSQTQIYLDQNSTELNHIKATKAWKVIQKINRVKSKLF